MAWGALATGRARRDRVDRPGPVADAGVVLRDHARRASARRSSTWPAASGTTSSRPGAAATATTATSCSRRWTSREAVELTQLAFHLADTWRNPVLVYGDYLLAHTSRRRSTSPRSTFGRLPRRTGRSTGRSAARAARRIVSSLGFGKPASPRPGIERTSSAMAREAGGDRRGGGAGRDRLHSTTPRPWWSRSGPRPSSCATSCEQLRAEGDEGRLRAPDHALAVPVRSSGRRGRRQACGSACSSCTRAR